MIQTTATNLRRNLFSLLEKVGEGETVTVTKGGKIVARILPEQRPDWRAKMPPGPKLLVPADEAFSPMPDEWGDLA